MTSLDQAKTVRPGETLDADRIGNYLKKELPGLDGPVRVRQFHSGFSNLTYLLTIGGTELVLRRPPVGKKPKRPTT